MNPSFSLMQTIQRETSRFRYMEMTHLYDAAIREMRTRLETLDREFRLLYSYNPIHHIDSRLKSPQSIFQKLADRDWPLTIESAEEHLTDIAGVRIVCNYINDIYRIADMIRMQQDIETIAIKDYISHPKPNGYRSMHLILRLPVYMTSHTELVPVEVQIRTIAMDFWASLEHELRYKNNLSATSSLKERLQICAEQSAALDREMQSIYNEMRAIEKENAISTYVS